MSSSSSSDTLGIAGASVWVDKSPSEAPWRALLFAFWPKVEEEGADVAADEVLLVGAMLFAGEEVDAIKASRLEKIFFFSLLLYAAGLCHRL